MGQAGINDGRCGGVKVFPGEGMRVKCNASKTSCIEYVRDFPKYVLRIATYVL